MGSKLENPALQTHFPFYILSPYFIAIYLATKILIPTSCISLSLIQKSQISSKGNAIWPTECVSKTLITFKRKIPHKNIDFWLLLTNWMIGQHRTKFLITIGQSWAVTPLLEKAVLSRSPQPPHFLPYTHPHFTHFWSWFLSLRYFFYSYHHFLLNFTTTS